MMVWIVALRIVGVLIFLWGVCGGIIRFMPITNVIGTFREFWATQPILESLALATLCFGAASALATLRRIDERTKRHNGALRRLMPNEYQRRDLAPHAPNNWQEFKPRPAEPLREKDSGIQQRVAQRRRYSNANLEDDAQEFTRPITIRRDRK